MTAEPVSLAERVDAGRAALIVIDMQNDFCHPDGAITKEYGLDVAAGRAILPRLHELAKAARAAGVPVFYTQMMNDSTTESPAFVGRRSVWGKSTPVCRVGTWGAELWGVEVEPGDIVV